MSKVSRELELKRQLRIAKEVNASNVELMDEYRNTIVRQDILIERFRLKVQNLKKSAR